MRRVVIVGPAIADVAFAAVRDVEDVRVLVLAGPPAFTDDADWLMVVDGPEVDALVASGWLEVPPC